MRSTELTMSVAESVLRYASAVSVDDPVKTRSGASLGVTRRPASVISCRTEALLAETVNLLDPRRKIHASAPP